MKEHIEINMEGNILHSIPKFSVSVLNEMYFLIIVTRKLKISLVITVARDWSVLKMSFNFKI